jgi:hypothetical protein
MAFPLWKSISAVNMMIPKDERKYVFYCALPPCQTAADINRSLLLRLFDDNSEIINNLDEARKKQQAAGSLSPTSELDGAVGETNGGGEPSEELP